MAVTLHGTVSVPTAWDDESGLRRTVEVWRHAAPGLLPTHAGSEEPVRREFDPARLDDTALTSWRRRVWIAKRTRPALESTFLSAGLHTGSVANFHIWNDRAVEHAPELQRLVEGLFRAWYADYGMVHALSAAEASELRATGRPDMMVVNRRTGRVGVHTGYTKQLSQGLPTLYWVNLFGRRYASVIGTGRLTSAPWSSVSETDAGWMCRVSETPPTEDTWLAFREKRDAVMDFLGRSLFWPTGSVVPDLSVIHAGGAKSS